MPIYLYSRCSLDSWFMYFLHQYVINNGWTYAQILFTPSARIWRHTLSFSLCTSSLFFSWQFRGANIHHVVYFFSLTLCFCLLRTSAEYTHVALLVRYGANLHFCTSDVHRRWFILSECERWKLEYLYLSMVHFVSLVFKMSATEIVSEQ